jgi:copper transport protein
VVKALLLALVALAIAAPAASAHATLEGTTPARGAVLKTEPEQVVFRFNEPVEGTFGAVRVFDAKGKRADDGHISHPNGDGPKIAVGLRSGLPHGAYTATYRVVSADGHPVSGGIVFDVGAAGAAPAQSVDVLLKGTKAGPQTAVAMGVAKAVGYLAIALALGGMIFLFAVWGPAVRAAGLPGAGAPFACRARRLLAVAAGLGATATAAGIVLEGATAAGTSFFGALDERIVRDVLHTHFGTMWAIRLGAWLLLGAGLATAALLRRAPATVTVAAPSTAALHAAAAVAVAGGAGGRTSFSDRAVVRGSAQAGGPPLPGASPARILPGGPASAIGLGIVGCALALTPALGGHAATQSPVALLVPADVVHVVGMSAWLGGLAFLLVAVPAATRTLAPADRTRLLAATLQRFSPLALASVLALAVTGTVQALLEVRNLDALTGTAFGRAVAIKAILLTLLIGLGAINRQRVVPALRRLAAGGEAPGDAGRLLRRTLRAEVALVFVVLAVTGALTGYAPPTAATAASAGPVSVTQRMGPLDLQMTMDPARVGPNAVHMYLFKASDGAPFTGTKELTVKASLPSRNIGPLDLTLHRAGPGHYVADAVTLSPGGDWKLSVADRVSDFDEYTTTVKATVR